MRTGQLPKANPNPVIGRNEDIASIEAQLSGFGAVNLIGAGGIGKSCVATEIAHRWDGDVVFVNLRAAVTHEDVDKEIRSCLLSVGGQGASLQDRLRSSGATLVVFDHAETSVDWLAENLESFKPYARVLTVTRTSVGLDALYRLGPLAELSAVELFVHRLWKRGRESDASDSELVRIVQRQDGLPLAIVLAAQELRGLSFSDFAELLDDAFDDIADSIGQQSLVRSFEVSWSNLEPETAVTLGELSLHRGRFSASDGQQLLGLSKSKALKRMSRLSDLSLLFSEIIDGTTLFQVLEPIRVLAVKYFERDFNEGYTSAVKKYATRWLDEPSSFRATSVISVFKQTGVVDPNLAVKLAIRAMTPVHLRQDRASRFLLNGVFDPCFEEMVEQGFELHCLAAEMLTSEWGDAKGSREHFEKAKVLSTTPEQTKRLDLSRARVAISLGQPVELEQLIQGGADTIELAQTALMFGDYTRSISFSERADPVTLKSLTIFALAKAIETDVVDFSAVESSTLGTSESRAWFGLIQQRLSPSQTFDSELEHEDSTTRLSLELLTAQRERDLKTLTRISQSSVRWSQPHARHASVLLALLALEANKPLEALEQCRVALAQCDEDAQRAMISRIGCVAAERADRAADAKFLWERVDSLTTPLVAGAFELTDLSATSLWRYRADNEKRFSILSWIDWVPLCANLVPSAIVETPQFVWKVSDEARWLQNPTGEMLNLSRRGPMRKMLWHLVLMRVNQTGLGTDVNSIFEIAWPGEVIDHELMLARVYNSIRALRGMGLEHLILTHDDGYLLDPEVVFEII